MKKFQDKVVLITGASAGIGAALAREFARRGARIALLARRISRLRTLAAEIRRNGGRALAIRCDVTATNDLDNAAKSVREAFGAIDIVIANAGFEVTGPFELLGIEDYRRQFETNVFGVLRTIYVTLEDLKKSHGCLVLIGSMLGHIVLPNTTAYSMSKFSVTALAEGLRRELRPDNIRVVLITPGNIETEIRKVDNRDIFHPDLDDPIPSWLRIPADHAAKQIVAAISARRSETVLTRVGKLAVFTQRHVPELVSLAIDLGHLHGRPEPHAPRAVPKKRPA